MLTSSRVFPKEAFMFNTVVPAIEAALNARVADPYPPFTARCLGFGEDPSLHMILQDLAPEGFKMADRHRGLDLDHALLAVRTLGRYHAASCSVLKENPSFADELPNYFSKESSFDETMLQSLKKLGNTIKTWEGYEVYGEKLRNMSDKLFPIIHKLNEPDPTGLNVILHGDFWVNNMMFRYESGEVKDIRFVDLQMCHPANPANDLVLFRFTSLSEEICFDEWDSILEEYQRSFSEAAKTLGSEELSLQRLKEYVDKCEPMAVMAACMWLPIIKMDPGFKFHVEGSMKEGSSNEQTMYACPTYKNWIQKLLPYFDKKGLLDLHTDAAMEKDEERTPPPSWLTAAFIEDALRRGGRTNAVVRAMDATHATAKGDHYASEMWRVKASLQDGSVESVIVKCLPPGEKFQQMMKESQVFQTEGHMFGSIVPAMENYLREAVPEGVRPFTARCLHHGSEPSEFLVLEDLSAEGFVLADRFRGLGLRHALMALRALARFHAASVPLLKDKTSVAYSFPNVFTQCQTDFKIMMVKNFLCLAKEVEKWEDSPEMYSEKVRKCADFFYERCRKINDQNPDKFNVLLHGDFWVNNMLFKYENNQPIDIRLVDLQISHIASPAIDIIYFLYTSVSEEVSKHHLDLLLREYFFTLNETLSLVGCSDDRISFETFQEHLKECSCYMLFAAIGVLPIIKSPKNKVFDIENSLDTDNETANAHLIASPLYQRWMKRLLPIFDKIGILD